MKRRIQGDQPRIRGMAAGSLNTCPPHPRIGISPVLLTTGLFFPFHHPADSAPVIEQRQGAVIVTGQVKQDSIADDRREKKTQRYQ